MKDERLEKEFGEYFEGVSAPDNIIGDAKNLVRPRRKILPKFVKFASLAASFVLVFAVALTIVLKTDFSRDETGQPPSGSTPGTLPDDGFKYYTDAELSTISANAYSLSSLNKSLQFIENFAIASNASVNSCETAYTDGKLTLAKATVSVLNGFSRDETEVFVEFTEKNLIYGELADYYQGSKRTYRGAEYYLTQSVAENGEPNFKLNVLYMGVKYYFDVTSSDETAYQRYLDLIIK